MSFDCVLGIEVGCKSRCELLKFHCCRVSHFLGSNILQTRKPGAFLKMFQPPVQVRSLYVAWNHSDFVRATAFPL